MEIFEVIKSGNLQRVKELLSENPSLINSSDENGISAVLLAAYYRQASIVEELLSRGPDLNIFETVVVGNSEKLEQKLSADQSQLSKHSKDGFSLLGLACYFGHYEIARYLINLGADVNDVSQNDFMVAPIHSAVSSQNLEICKLLLENGANPNLAQTKGIRPIHQAAHSGNIALLALLLDYGADPKIASEEGKRALDFAKEAKANDIIKILSPS